MLIIIIVLAYELFLRFILLFYICFICLIAVGFNDSCQCGCFLLMGLLRIGIFTFFSQWFYFLLLQFSPSFRSCCFQFGSILPFLESAHLLSISPFFFPLFSFLLSECSLVAPWTSSSPCSFLFLAVFS